MNRPRLLSKSDYMLARTCEAKLYFRENGYPDNRDSDPYLQLLARGGYMVEALAKARYAGGIQLDYGRDPAVECDLTRDYLGRDDVTLFEATLLHGRRLARADIVQKQGNTIRLIECKAKSFNGEEHLASLAQGKPGVFRAARKPFGVAGTWREKLEDITYQVLILERMLPGIEVKPYLLLVDVSKRAGIDDVPGLFEIVQRTGRDGRERLHSARFRGDPALLPQLDVISEVEVSAEVALLRDEVDEAAARYELLLDAPLERFTPAYGANCADCEYRTGLPGRDGFRDCWGELADATPHVLELFSVGKVRGNDGGGIVESLFRAGRATLYDIPEAQLTKADGTVGPLAERQRRQIDCTRTGTAWISPELERAIESVQYPAHFIDFEASRLALPYHAQMRPYGQVAFQWSSHTTRAPGARPEHAEWLNTADEWPNEAFVRALRTWIGDDGSVLAWSAFEGTTLRTVADELPVFGRFDRELAEWIQDLVHRRIVDLRRWAETHYYHPGMRGRSSIKVVLDALWRSDAAMRAQFESWTGLVADPATDPYASLSPLVINGVVQDVREGTGAVSAYEAMMYGVERTDTAAKESWRRLLLQYCALDSLSMLLIFEHWRRAVAAR